MQGLWEFPGGKVERGESPEDACVRELSEELQVRVTDLRAFYTVEYDYDDFHLSMECFFCSIDGKEGQAEPQRSDRQLDIRWIERRELATLEWMPADKDLVEALVASAQDEGARHAGEDKNEPEAPKTAPKRRGSKRKKSLLDGINTEDLSSSETELVRRRAAIKKSMQGNKRANTKPEMLVRQRLREAGLTGVPPAVEEGTGATGHRVSGTKDCHLRQWGASGTAARIATPARPSATWSFGKPSFAATSSAMRGHGRSSTRWAGPTLTIWECELKRDRIDETMAHVIEQVRAAERC